MKIHLFAIGKLKKRFWRTAAEEYELRIRFYTRYESTELKDANPSKKPIAVIKEEESKSMLRRLPSNAFIVALDKSGRQFSTREFAAFLREKEMYGPSNVCFCIGGPLGFSNTLLREAQLVFSLSKLTFPHELARIMLLEQIYRAFTIVRGENYHK